MGFKRFYNKILGTPWVYDNVRPFVLGYFNEAYRYVYSVPCFEEKDIIIDVGCGTGNALDYIETYKEYHGFDVDDRALNSLKSKHRDKLGTKVFIYMKNLSPSDIQKISPTKVLLIGVLHHLSSEEIHNIFMAFKLAPIVRIVTFDVLYIKGRFINNILAARDRGQYVRQRHEYEEEIINTGYRINDSRILQSGNGLAKYLLMDIKPWRVINNFISIIGSSK